MGIFKLTMPPSLFVIAAACGGSTTSPDDTRPRVDVVPYDESANFAELADKVNFFEELSSSNEDLLFDEDGPTSGTATYVGFAAVVELDEEDNQSFVAIGDMNVDVDFADGSVSINAGRFYDVEIEAIDALENEVGSSFSDLEGSAVAIEGSFATELDGTIQGSLAKQSGGTVNYTFGNVETFFAGEDHELVQVDSEEGTSSTGVDVEFSGVGQR